MPPNTSYKCIRCHYSIILYPRLCRSKYICLVYLAICLLIITTCKSRYETMVDKKVYPFVAHTPHIKMPECLSSLLENRKDICSTNCNAFEIFLPFVLTSCAKLHSSEATCFLCTIGISEDTSRTISFGTTSQHLSKARKHQSIALVHLDISDTLRRGIIGCIHTIPELEVPSNVVHDMLCL